MKNIELLEKIGGLLRNHSHTEHRWTPEMSAQYATEIETHLTRKRDRQILGKVPALQTRVCVCTKGGPCNKQYLTAGYYCFVDTQLEAAKEK